MLSQPTFVEEMDDTRRRVFKHFPDLNLNFLDEDEPEEDSPIEGAPTSRAARAEWIIDAPSSWTFTIIFYIHFYFYCIAGQSYRDHHSIKPLDFFYIINGTVSISFLSTVLWFGMLKYEYSLTPYLISWN